MPRTTDATPPTTAASRSATGARTGAPAGPVSAAPLVPHSATEDVVGLASGAVLASFGLFLLHTAGLVTGGTAGLALLVGYASGMPFTVLFVLVNLPFFVLAARTKGWSFTVRSALSTAGVAVLAGLHQLGLPHLAVHPVYAALLGNLAAGVGILIVFRHRSSLGGFGVLALLAQERLGWRAGYVQMAFDVAVVLSALAVAPPGRVLLSAVGAAVLNLVLALNHRPGRYLG